MSEGKDEAMEATLLSTREVAEIKGVTQQAIRAAIARNALPAKKVGRDYLITRADCTAYNPIKENKDRSRKTPIPNEQPGQETPKG